MVNAAPAAMPRLNAAHPSAQNKAHHGVAKHHHGDGFEKVLARGDDGENKLKKAAIPEEEADITPEDSREPALKTGTKKSGEKAAKDEAENPPQGILPAIERLPVEILLARALVENAVATQQPAQHGEPVLTAGRKGPARADLPDSVHAQAAAQTDEPEPAGQRAERSLKLPVSMAGARDTAAGANIAPADHSEIPPAPAPDVAPAPASKKAMASPLEKIEVRTSRADESAPASTKPMQPLATPLSAAAGTAIHALPSDLAAPAQQIIDHISLPAAALPDQAASAKAIVKTLKFELKPELLGLVHVTLKLTAGKMEISIEAQKQETEAILRADTAMVEQIVRTVTASGDVSSVSVNVGSSGAQSNPDSSWTSASGEGARQQPQQRSGGNDVSSRGNNEASGHDQETHETARDKAPARMSALQSRVV